MQLALVGSMASDDPEGWDFYNSTLAHAEGDPDIHILNNFNNVGAHRGQRVPVAGRRRDPEVHARGLRPDRHRGALEGPPVHRRRRRRHPAAGGGRRVGLPRLLAWSSARQRSLEILNDPALGKALGRRGKEHVRAHFLTPRLPSRLAANLPRGAVDASRDRPARPRLQPRARHVPGDGSSEARHRRAGDGADRARVPPRRGLDRLGDDGPRTWRSAGEHGGEPFDGRRAGRRRPTASASSSPTRRPTTASTTSSPTRCCGSSSTTCGTCATRRTSAATRSTRSSTATTSVNEDLARAVLRGDRGRRRARRDGPRLPPLHAAGDGPARAQPDVFLHHFVHIPWTQPDAWRVLPKDIRDADLPRAARERHRRLPHALLPAQLPASAAAT